MIVSEITIKPKTRRKDGESKIDDEIGGNNNRSSRASADAKK